MNRYCLYILAIILLLGAELEARDMGAEIYYKHIGGMKYVITLSRPRDCSGNPMSEYPIKIFNDSFSVSFLPKFLKREEIKSSFCPSTCKSGSSTLSRAELMMYSDTIDFSDSVFSKFGSKNYPEVYFSFSAPYRNVFITIFTSDGTYVESMLNLYYVRLSKKHVEFKGFTNPMEPFIQLNKTFIYSFGVFTADKEDSLVYQLVGSKNSHGQDISYSSFYTPKIPFQIYCTGIFQNCKTNIKTLPVQGMYFDEGNGNIMFTPTAVINGVLVCKVKMYRRIGNVLVLMGYIERDIETKVVDKDVNKPYIVGHKDYVVKAREQFCLDIEVKDDPTFAQIIGDTVVIEFNEKPQYGSVRLLDSNSQEKTIRYCWTANDSDYILKHKSKLNFRVFEKTCNKLENYSLSKIVEFSVLPPDSISTIRIKTYWDKNKNGKKDAGEYYKSAPFYCRSANGYLSLSTDTSGVFVYNPLYGKFSFNIRENAQYFTLQNAQSIDSKFDSIYYIDLGFEYRHGVKGRMFEDKNANCIYDIGDRPIASQKLQLKGDNTVAFTDENGYYFIQAEPGTYSLESVDHSAYIPICTSKYTIDMITDSIQSGFDFPVQKRTDYKDISVSMPVLAIDQGNQVLNETILIENKGFKTERNICVKVLPSFALLDVSSNRSIHFVDDTLQWLIDSLPASEILSIKFTHTIKEDSFLNARKLCFLLKLDADSNTNNDQLSFCRGFADSMYDGKYKVSRNPEQIFQDNKGMTYTISFSDQYLPHARLFMKDTLDVSIFDLNTFRVIDNPLKMKVNLVDNILMVEYLSNVVKSQNYSLTYTIDFRTSLNKRIQIENSGHWTLDDEDKNYSSKVLENNVSGFQIGALLDTIYCPGDNIALELNAKFKPKFDNHFKVYISDSTGSMAKRTLLLDTICAARKDILQISLPTSMHSGKAYRLKVESSSPNMSSFDQDFNQKIEVLLRPKAVLINNLKPGNLICKNDTLKLLANGGQYFLFYYMQNAFGNFSTVNSLNFVPTFNQSKIALEVKNNFGCIDRTANVDFKISPLPKVLIKANPDELCDGRICSVGVSGAKTYDIYENTVPWLNSIDGKQTYNRVLSTSTNFMTNGTDSVGCKSAATVHVIVNATPSKPVIYHTKNYLQSSYLYGNKWFEGNVKIDSADGQIFYPPKNGVYSVENTNSKSCFSRSDPYNFTITGIEQTDFESIFKLFPNPAYQSLNIEFVSFEEVALQIFSSDARMMYSVRPENNHLIIDVSSFSPGVYTVVVVIGNNVYRKVFLLMR